MKVLVYYNLRRHKWSIKAMEGEQKNRVIGHADSVYLTSVTPKVSEAGRQRVLREKQKNVHAGLVGYLIYVSADSTLHSTYNSGAGLGSITDGYEITYNPYKYRTFVKKDSPTEEMLGADLALMHHKRVHCFRMETTKKLLNNS